MFVIFHAGVAWVSLRRLADGLGARVERGTVAGQLLEGRELDDNGVLAAALRVHQHVAVAARAHRLDRSCESVRLALAKRQVGPREAIAAEPTERSSPL